MDWASSNPRRLQSHQLRISYLVLGHLANLAEDPPIGPSSSTAEMAFAVSTLWKAPEVNPLNHKARSIPALNLLNLYGRVFFFSWFGFLIAFWSW